MGIEEKRKEVIQFLRNYNCDSNDYKAKIVLAAPAYGNPNEIRAYMNGGNVGKIAINEKSVTTGIKSKQYSNKHKGNVPDIVHVLEKDSGFNESDRLDALIDTEYLRYAQEATTTYSVKNNNNSDKERSIETLIMDFRNQRFGNAAIDMEMQYSAKDHFGWTRHKKPGREYLSSMEYRNHIWYNEDYFPDSAETKSPRVDLMILNSDGIGFVELKVDNENCDNLSSHISHMSYILSHQEVFIEDVIRRLSVLKEFNLLEEEMRPNIDKWEKNHQIWCGILFVGSKDKLTEAKQMINKELNDNQCIRCCFVDTRVVKAGKLDMRSDIFVNKATFVSPDYYGERFSA